MKEVTYGVIEERYAAGTLMRTSYGIAAYSYQKQCGTASGIVSVHDITDNLEQISALVERCNNCDLSVEQLKDVVDDYLAQ